MLRLALPCLLALVALPTAAQGVAEISATAPRTLFETTDRIKGDDGAYVVHHTTLTYDPALGVYVYLIQDETGAVLARRELEMYLKGPTPAEEAAAQALIEGHPEISGLMAKAGGEVVVSGGFPLVREEGHGCGPGSRCLQYDVYEITGDRSAERIRYVVVDLREVRVFDADFDVATEGNLAHPAARAQSRRSN